MYKERSDKFLLILGILVGAASSLVLTLAGVIKDILLIVGSVILFGNAITRVQVGGYAIALVGLVLFKLKG